MPTRIEIAADLKKHLRKAVPVAEFSVRQSNMGILVEYYGGDEAFNVQVKKAVADYFGQDEPKVQFEAKCGLWISLYWNSGGKPIGKATYSAVVGTVRIPVEGHTTLETLRTFLSCGHHTDRFAYRNKKYGAEKGVKKRVKCWDCTIQQHEREREEYQAFLRSIGLKGKTPIVPDCQIPLPPIPS